MCKTWWICAGRFRRMSRGVATTDRRPSHARPAVCEYCHGRRGFSPPKRVRWRALGAARTSSLAYLSPRTIGVFTLRAHSWPAARLSGRLMCSCAPLESVGRSQTYRKRIVSHNASSLSFQRRPPVPAQVQFPQWRRRRRVSRARAWGRDLKLCTRAAIRRRTRRF